MAVFRRFSVGRFFTTSKPTPYDGERWALDNGAYSDFLQGSPFDVERFERNLAYAEELHRPDFVMLPDVVGDKETTLRWADEWISRTWPWYLVIQDGMEPADIAPFWKRLRGLFLGGTDKLKQDADMWCRVAHDKGKKFHYGRAGTPRKLSHAIRCGSDSADSARLAMMTPKEYGHMLYLIHNPQAAFYVGDLLNIDD
tara:strand:+ start:288 stop:881 length:594 start_codon:yes stop_codon:yes gene_type:complete